LIALSQFLKDDDDNAPQTTQGTAQNTMATVYTFLLLFLISFSLNKSPKEGELISLIFNEFSLIPQTQKMLIVIV